VDGLTQIDSVRTLPLPLVEHLSGSLVAMREVEAIV
jgi:hypothetical protein